MFHGGDEEAGGSELESGDGEGGLVEVGGEGEVRNMANLNDMRIVEIGKR